MVAKICQEFPDLQPSCTLYKFFEVYAESRWLEPVQMSLTNKYKAAKGGSLRMHLIEAVNRYSSDAMVVLTPNDQLQNTSYRVSEHNFRIICKELSDGLKTLQLLKPQSHVIFKQPLVEQENELEEAIKDIEQEGADEESKTP